MASTSGLLGVIGRLHVGVTTYNKAGTVYWVNSLNGIEQTGFFTTQYAAMEVGRSLAIANRTEHTILNEDGRIREKNSYGHDPRNIRG